MEEVRNLVVGAGAGRWCPQLSGGWTRGVEGEEGSADEGPLV